MEIQTQTLVAKGITFSIVESDRELARAYLYLMHNNLHHEPFGLLEDVYVVEDYRGKGLGTRLLTSSPTFTPNVVKEKAIPTGVYTPSVG